MAPANSRPGLIYSSILISDNVVRSVYGLNILVFFPMIKITFASIFPAQLKPREASDLKTSRLQINTNRWSYYYL